MSEDRSLDEFASGSGEGEGAPETTEATEATDPGPSEADTLAGSDADEDTTSSDADEADAPDVNAVDPATLTMRFEPGGASCDACGETVERRWHDDGAFVCDDCKAW
jgi:formylmethanofuran dehydrogenase subunit E